MDDIEKQIETSSMLLEATRYFIGDANVLWRNLKPMTYRGDQEHTSRVSYTWKCRKDIFE